MAKRPGCLKLPASSYLQHLPEELPALEPSPEELALEHIDLDQLAAENDIDRDCRYAQKILRRRKRLFRWALQRIPQDEREAVLLSLAGKSQRDIAAIQGISQMMAMKHLRMAMKRIQWLCSVGRTVTPTGLRRATDGLLCFEDQRILLAWWDTGSQSATAERVFKDRRKQYLCRASILRSKTIIGQIGRLWRISQALESLWNNPYVRHDFPHLLRPKSPITRLSQTERIEAFCRSGCNNSSMTRCSELR